VALYQSDGRSTDREADHVGHRPRQISQSNAIMPSAANKQASDPTVPTELHIGLLAFNS